MRQYEDLFIGESGRSDTLTVELAEMLEWSKKYDPQWFHADPEQAQQAVFGEVIASGIYTAALWRMLDHQINHDVDFICGVAWKDTRWPNVVKAGDTLYATSEIIAKRTSKSEETRGVITFRYSLFNQHNDLVFSCDSINLVNRKPDPSG